MHATFRYLSSALLHIQKYSTQSSSKEFSPDFENGRVFQLCGRTFHHSEPRNYFFDRLCIIMQVHFFWLLAGMTAPRPTRWTSSVWTPASTTQTASRAFCTTFPPNWKAPWGPRWVRQICTINLLTSPNLQGGPSGQGLLLTLQ